MVDHPYMDEGLRRWIASYARQNFWRVDHGLIPTIKELRQEGYYCYLKVLRHPNYSGLTKRRNPSKENRQVFMALVKRAFENHLHDLASAKTARPERAISHLAPLSEVEPEDWLEANALRDDDQDDPRDKPPLEHFSAALSDLRTAMQSDLGDAFGYIKTKCQRSGLTKRETNNQRWCRLANIIASKAAEELGFTPTLHDPKVVDMYDLAMQYGGAEAPG